MLMSAWLNNLDQQTAVLVPTRSLANYLSEQVATNNVEQGKIVWESPNILVWQDYLKLIWQTNRDAISRETGAHTLISNQQSLLLWTQVIESSRRKESRLTLLNVQQTVKAVQRSWRLMHDWQISQDDLSQDHVADIEQFLIWLHDYKTLLAKCGFIDEPLLLSHLCASKYLPTFEKLIWYSYDLITAAQKSLNNITSANGMHLQFKQAGSEEKSEEKSEATFLIFSDEKTELSSAFINARELIEKDPNHKINIVVPDLHRRQTEVAELARNVFYPSLSPLEVQLEQTAYRFSLGKPLNHWPAIETALSLIVGLKNRITVTELSFLLRNQFLSFSRNMRDECRLFDRWLKRQRVRKLSIDRLPNLYQENLDYLKERDQAPENSELLPALVVLAEQRSALQAHLTEQKQKTGFAALSFTQWVSVYTEWLSAWGWNTEVKTDEIDTVQYQLLTRWHSLIDEFASLATVQKQIGLNRAYETLLQMARDAVFMPKASASPILISGVYEAIGQGVDSCFLIGMSQAYPPIPNSDSFIPNRLLVKSNYPDANPIDSVMQSKQVVDSLLNTSNTVVISYSLISEQDREIENLPSPLFRNQEFSKATCQSGQSGSRPPAVILEPYQDTQGPAWADPSRVKGGSAIFKNQSNCAFRAFVVHQLGFLGDDEAEFGLDPLDRGSVVHLMLDKAWDNLQTLSCLKSMDKPQLLSMVKKTVAETVSDPELALNQDKNALLQFEKPRLENLLLEWLEFEAKRPEEFFVIERETKYPAEFAGIGFNFIIDRLDMMEDGCTAIIDYKTGKVARSDWLGERIKDPQLPLYALALDKIKQSSVSGIAYAQVRQHDHAFHELAEGDIFKPANKGYATKYEQLWTEKREQWPAMFEQLGKEFLAGNAQVNPIDDKTCLYCELQSVCRISQLKESSTQSGEPT